MTSEIRTYSKLILLPTFEERFEYLHLQGGVGESTFGGDRWLNQVFYRSHEWKRVRDFVIMRDNGCDLGIPGRELYGIAYIHHINPITKRDIVERSEVLLDPENLITVSKRTHDMIHYGNSDGLMKDPIIRSKNDTCPWRH